MLHVVPGSDPLGPRLSSQGFWSGRAQEVGIRCKAWPEFPASGSPCDDCLEPTGNAESQNLEAIARVAWLP